MQLYTKVSFMDYEFDNIDLAILKALQKDSRVSFLDLSRQLPVSSGTIHVRYNKMLAAGIVNGSRIMIDAEKLGYDVCAFVGINLQRAGDYKKILTVLQAIPEILEAHYTTGQYSIFIKVLAKSTRGLHRFLIEDLQAVDGIQSTETLISLETPINRDIPL